jgi:hypothetical protein
MRDAHASPKAAKKNRKVRNYGGVAEIIGSPDVDDGTAVAKVR